MRLKKFPVYVDGVPYKVVVKKKHDIQGVLYHSVKFYDEDKVFCVFRYNTYSTGTYVRNCIDYKTIISEAVEEFERKILREINQKRLDREFKNWDGKCSE